MSIATGNALLRQGKYELALQEFKKIPPNSPLYAQAQFNIEIARRRIGNSTLSDADLIKKNVAAVFNEPPQIGWTAVITTWKRSDYLEEQLAAIQGQSIAPKSIIIIQNESHFRIDKSLLARYNVQLVQSGLNSLYTRWIIGYLSDSEYVCVFDDDVIPGRRWIELCVTKSKQYNALVGPSGRRARPTEVPAWVSVESTKTGKDELVDWVCNSYFFRTEWIQYVVAANRYQGYQKTFDDIQLAVTLKAFGGVATVVPAQPKNEPDFNGHTKREYGHDEHALWKRQPTEHMIKRSEFIKKINGCGFNWV